MGATFNRVDFIKRPITDTSGDHDITDRNPTQEELMNAPSLTDAEYRAILKTDEFKNSPLVQKLAQVGRQKAVAEEIAAEEQLQAERGQHDAVERIGNRQAAELAVGRAAFTDPRYKTDASYRFKVAQNIAETQRTHGTGGTHQLTVGRGTPGEVVHHERSGPMRVTVSSTHNLNEPDKPTKPEPKPRDPNVVDLYFDR